LNLPVPKMATIDPALLAERILDGDRRALARGITLIESGRRDHQEQAEALIATLLPRTGAAIRIGISGTPGAGKSTFIEAIGQHVIEEGEKIAVLAVDPSSRRSGGSILGDKTRMPILSASRSAFVRPSPAGATLGGVAKKTREAAIACEAAGFGVILVETVGVGQSETAVADMVDCFLLLLAPGAGDDLQGIKRGIVELADLIVVNKTDGDLKPAAKRVQADYKAALHLLNPATSVWTPEVLTCSALEGDGIEEIWRTIKRHREMCESQGLLQRKRREQRTSWLWSEIRSGLLDMLHQNGETARAIQDLERQVEAGDLLPSAAARQLLGRLKG
jgi:LAO/AO transport system kinase